MKGRLVLAAQVACSRPPLALAVLPGDAGPRAMAQAGPAAPARTETLPIRRRRWRARARARTGTTGMSCRR